MTDPDAAGGGGEYQVVVGKSPCFKHLLLRGWTRLIVGFGWTNGVVLYLAGEYGKYLAPVSCPLIPIIEIDYEGRNGTSSSTSNSTSSVNFTAEDGGSNIQNQTQAKIFAGYRIPRH
jgi:alpha,alpha-trehalase